MIVRWRTAACAVQAERHASYALMLLGHDVDPWTYMHVRALWALLPCFSTSMGDVSFVANAWIIEATEKVTNYGFKCSKRF